MSIRKGSSIIAGNGGSGSGSAMNVDNITTQLNQNDEIQTIGIIEKNNSSPKYDWVGTYNEWVLGRSTGTINDSWICYITDDDGNVTSSKERTLGEIIFSLIPQSDPALHLLDGSLINGTGVYNAFYTYMKNLYDNGYDKCFTDENDWQSSVTNYGVCGKFVLDTSNQTIRLPMIEGFVEGTLDEDDLGELTEAGLPNITGTFHSDAPANQSTGAFGIDGSTYTYSATSSNAKGDISFDASRLSTIYGNSDTVQPQSIKGFYYIVLSTSVDLDVPLDVNAVVNDVTNIQTEISAADYVVEYQRPTSENNYTWYRLYKSGWVEQGGSVVVNSASVAGGNYATTNITFPITLQTSRIWKCQAKHDRFNAGFTNTEVTSGATIYQVNDSTASFANPFVIWEVKGFAAQS